MTITFTQLGNYGRLGNMLFEIAAVISLALKNNDNYIFPPWEYQPFFNLHNCFSNSITPTLKYQEPYFHYSPILHTNTNNQILDMCGYFQSEKYFEDYKDVILSLMTPNIGYGIKYNHTSIHIRRGDYVNLTNEYVQLDISYYKSAMDFIKSKNYIIFSDDISWCKTQFTGDNVIFSEGKSPIEDLALQLSCEHNIIANSSFSWWAAFLNKNPSKIVIAPSKWFGPKLPHDTTDLLPTNWIKI